MAGRRGDLILDDMASSNRRGRLRPNHLAVVVGLLGVAFAACSTNDETTTLAEVQATGNGQAKENEGAGDNGTDADDQRRSASDACPSDFRRIDARRYVDPVTAIGIVTSETGIEAFDVASGTSLWAIDNARPADHWRSRDPSILDPTEWYTMTIATGVTTIVAGTGEEIHTEPGGDNYLIVPASTDDGRCTLVLPSREGRQILSVFDDGTDNWSVPGGLLHVDEDTGTVLGLSPSGFITGWDLSTGAELWRSDWQETDLDTYRAKAFSGGVVFVTEGDGPAFGLDARTGQTTSMIHLPRGSIEFHGADAPVLVFSSGTYWAGLTAQDGLIAWERNDLIRSTLDAFPNIVSLDGSPKLVELVAGHDQADYLVLFDMATGREEWVISDFGDHLANDTCNRCLKRVWQTGETTVATDNGLSIDLRTGEILFSYYDLGYTEYSPQSGSDLEQRQGWPGLFDWDTQTATYFDPVSGRPIWQGPRLAEVASPGQILIIERAGEHVGLDARTGEVRWTLPYE